MRWLLDAIPWLRPARDARRLAAHASAEVARSRADLDDLRRRVRALEAAWSEVADAEVRAYGTQRDGTAVALGAIVRLLQELEAHDGRDGEQRGAGPGAGA